ncbi:MAG: hypothetical protein CBD16_06005 [Betaproteobacteria bacterium TMED156]|nr:MAG: hypothetical protein CBD16_06005 [Betaproteobacteria bacterium TMED156]
MGPDVSKTESSPIFDFSWLIWATVFLIIFVSLLTWSPQDGGWFQISSREQPENLLGRFGASLSDFMIFCFGFSSIWWPILFGYLSILAFKKNLRKREMEKLKNLSSETTKNKKINYEFFNSKSSFHHRTIGFLMLLSGSVVIEAQRLNFENLILNTAPGGALGNFLGSIGEWAFGPFGLMVISVFFLFLGVSLFFGFSWFTAFEILGKIIEAFYAKTKLLIQSLEDNRLGIKALQARMKKKEKTQNSFYDNTFELKVKSESKSSKINPDLIGKRNQQTLFDNDTNGELPPLTLLIEASVTSSKISQSTLAYTSRLIETRLNDFGVQVRVVSAQPGPVVTQYEIEPAVGVKGAQIVGLAKDLARSLSLLSIRVVETIPGKSFMGLELPNPKREVVRLSEVLGSKSFLDNSATLPLALGKDISGIPVVFDLAKMPHLLVAGTTGAGKSVGINAMLLSLIYHSTPEKIRFILIDPKMLEFSMYEDIPHLLTPVVTDVADAGKALRWCVSEMERRYKLMSLLNVRSLTSFNQKVSQAINEGIPIENPFFDFDQSSEKEDAQNSTQQNDYELRHLAPLPKIVVVIDELADLMMVVGKKIESLIARLAQKARAAGIHLILATQRPSVDVITGLIKANIPARISFQVSSRVDSRTILDQMGAETLLGQGDMLFLMPGSGLPVRIHGAFVADEEVLQVVEFIKSSSTPSYVNSIMNETFDLDSKTGDFSDISSAKKNDAEKDPLFDEAVAIILKNRRASISLVQRHLRIGYNRAARLLDAMQSAGIVSEMQSNGNRDILIPSRD